MSEPVALLPCPPGHVWVRWSPDAIVTAQLCDGGTCEAPAHELNLGGSHHPTSITALCLPIEATQTDQRGDTTQWADDMAAQMRAYYEAHKRDRWVDGTADNLMLGLLNIALRPDQQLRASTALNSTDTGA